MGLTIGVDVGGTKVAAGVVDDDGKILRDARRPMPAMDPKAAVEAIVDAVEDLRAEHQVHAIGIGAAGFVDVGRSMVLFAPNIAWRDEDIGADISTRLGVPVVVENDANAAAWAEYRFGAGQGESHLVLVTVGTGIGGGVVVDGRLYRGRYGVGAEVGHMVLVDGGRPCGCGQLGCLEQYASGHALAREARTRAADDRAGSELLRSLGDGTPEGISGKHVTTAAQQGDPVAKAAFEAVGTALGAGLASMAAVLDPGLFVIGGGVSEAGDLLVGPARAAFSTHLTGGDYRPHAEVRLAALGNAAGIVGAADLARTD
jgi:glucokinase